MPAEDRFVISEGPEAPRGDSRVRGRVVAAIAAAIVLLVAVAVAGGLREEPEVREPPPPKPTPDGRELFGGSLEPGVRYRTRAFVPALSFEVADDDWFVPDATAPAFLQLDRRNRTDAPGSEATPLTSLIISRVVAVFDPHVPGIGASRSPAPAELYEWLRDHPDLRVGRPRPVTVAGVPGEIFDARFRFDRPAHGVPCEEARSRSRAPQLATCAALTPGIGFLDGSRVRTYVLATEPNPLVITLAALPGGDLGELAEAAAPVLESLRIGIR